MWPLSSNTVALLAVAGFAIAVLALLVAISARWSLARDRRRRGENQLPWAELKILPTPDLGWFVGRIEIHNPSGQSLAVEELRVEKPTFMRLAALPSSGVGPRTVDAASAKPARTLDVAWIVNEPHLPHSDLAYAGEFLVQCAPSMIQRWTTARTLTCRIVVRGRFRSAKARRFALPAPGTLKI